MLKNESYLRVHLCRKGRAGDTLSHKVRRVVTGGHGYRRKRSCCDERRSVGRTRTEEKNKRNPVNPKEFPDTKCLKDDRSERPEGPKRSL